MHDSATESTLPFDIPGLIGSELTPAQQVKEWRDE